jgi:cytochrome d ubiquinol oxidase subunit II
MEYRSKYGDEAWRARWDNAIVVSSFLPALLWGVAFANIVRGVPLEIQNNVIEYTGGFFNLLNPYGLLGGMVTLSVFMTHGAIFLALKTDGAIRDRARNIATRIGYFAAVVTVAFLAITVTAYNDKLEVYGLAAIVAVAWLLALGSNLRGREGYAFLYSSIALAFAVITLFSALYPNVMPSSLLEAASLTINNASSTPYTLKVMTYVAVVLTPVVLLYQGWTYWVFRKRINAAQIPTPEAGALDSVKY